MLLMIDNYDSFVFNLLSYFEELGEEVDIISAGDFEEADPAWAEKYDAILLSPGPKGPKDATLCLSVMEKLAGRIPILGVCLGHQVIAHALGATVEKGDRPYHGKLSPVFHKKIGLFFTMLLSHITFTTPYVILAVLPKLSQMNKFLPEAAMDMGATPFYTLRKVVLPEIKTGVFSGSLLAFTLSIDDFVISFFTTGHGVSNLSVTVYSMAKKGVNPAINALSTIMFLVMVILLLILHKRTNLLEEL